MHTLMETVCLALATMQTLMEVGLITGNRLGRGQTLITVEVKPVVSEYRCSSSEPVSTSLHH